MDFAAKTLIEGSECRKLWENDNFINSLFKSEADDPVCERESEAPPTYCYVVPGH